MKIRQATHPDMVVGATTAELRQYYLLTDLFVPDEIRLNYSHVERLIAGGVSPVKGPLTLQSVAGVGPGPFLSRRELGVINIGGPGKVTANGRAYSLAPRDGFYAGMGTPEVVFESADPARPAKFYVVSAPAHASYDTVKIPSEAAEPMRAGSQATANQRTINQYIHPDVCKSSQLLLGLTALEVGSIWNTMPPHLHDRRSEIYFYFDMQPEDRVFHFMGEPSETRHIIVANEQAVIAPPWSIHMGAGTSRYSFIWSMAGDNLDYKDMDAVPTPTLL
jgi:4-deoxy-L-threo-5-hexosulose-uronate ketol-isomerase